MNRIFETLCTTGLLASFLITASSSISAATVFFDNFEDGNTSGWLESTLGVGSTVVELHNSSQMARVQQIGGGGRTLSMDFDYLASEMLSFDMHAVANSASRTGETVHSASGVKLSFLNTFNVALGSTRLIRTTNASWLVGHDNSIDGVQHNYSALMSDYAGLAGLSVVDPISKINLSFFTSAQTGFFGQKSTATVWFDNVTIGDVSTVPVPAAAWLFGSGLLGLIGVAKRKKA